MEKVKQNWEPCRVEDIYIRKLVDSKISIGIPSSVQLQFFAALNRQNLNESICHFGIYNDSLQVYNEMAE